MANFMKSLEALGKNALLFLNNEVLGSGARPVLSPVVFGIHHLGSKLVHICNQLLSAPIWPFEWKHIDLMKLWPFLQHQLLRAFCNLNWEKLTSCGVSRVTHYIRSASEIILLLSWL